MASCYYEWAARSHQHSAPLAGVVKEYTQHEWDAAVAEDCREIVRLAVREDLERLFDWTTLALVPPGTEGAAAIVVRQPGVVCGLRAAEVALSEMDAALQLSDPRIDGDVVEPGTRVGIVKGPARSLLAAERILLNLMGRLSGVASLTRQYVEAVAGTSAQVYDTRKTTPGFRLMEKYAVRCGGGRNHRTGLYDAILIKDNHLALAAEIEGVGHLTPAEAVRRARDFVDAKATSQQTAQMIVEVEVDSLDQLAEVLPEQPDVVLLDNMSPDMLREAVALRDRLAGQVQLEASGRVNLETVASLAASGVERISVGALTHSAPALDVGLDWL
ncbi:MAG: carboxylating nicotinate-nucleotide diphosphorylase [Planctomycetota bacterium]|nr:MAG: carboxylating nicotinate-nucleotide diphosphorylase [Planctomycetota bacterium]